MSRILVVDKSQVEQLIVGASLLALFCIVTLNAMLNHMRKKRGVPISSHKNSFRALKLTNILFFCLFIGFIVKFQIGWLDLLIYGTYLFFTINVYGFVIWNGFAITDVSMHIHLLVEVFRAQRISYAELTTLYNKQKVISERIPRLLSLGQLVEKEGKLYLSGNAVLLGANICVLFRRLLGIPARPPLSSGIRHD